MNDLERLREWERQRREQEETELSTARAEAERRGKEPFDFERLSELCDLASDMAYDVHEPEATARSHEVRYYLIYTQVDTLAEYAAVVERDAPYR